MLMGGTNQWLISYFFFVCLVVLGVEIQPQHRWGEQCRAEQNQPLEPEKALEGLPIAQDYTQSSILTPLASSPGLCSSPPQGSRHGLLWRLPWQLRRCDVIGGWVTARLHTSQGGRVLSQAVVSVGPTVTRFKHWFLRWWQSFGSNTTTIAIQI